MSSGLSGAKISSNASSAVFTGRMSRPSISPGISFLFSSVTHGGSEAPLALVGKDFAATAEYLGLAVFAAFLVIFSKVVLSGKR